MGVFAMRGKRSNRPPRVRQAGATILLLLLACGVAWGQVPDSEKDPQSPPSDLTKVSIENLMNMEVTSVSKKEQKMSQVAEAIFVITQDDIHHSGATNIPDLLRMAPGMDVTEGAVIVHSVLSPPDNLEVERLAKLSGGNVLTRWNHISSNRSDTTVKFYFDRYARSGPESREARDTIDFEFQNHLKIGNRQDLVWGLGYRHSADQTVGTIDQAFVPANWSGHSFNWYAQDQITLKRNRVDLFIGTKLEKGYFTGLDLQPSVRLTWTPTQRHTVWAAVSRATSTPTRREEGLNAVLAALPGPAEVVLLGSPEGNSEHVISYELGYRTQPSARLSFDLAAFFSNYGGLETIEPLPSFTVPNSDPPLLVLPRLIDDKMRGTTEGIETILNWKATSRWSVSPGYALLKMDLQTKASSLDPTRVEHVEGSNPAHQAQIRSHVALSRGMGWDASAYFTGKLAAQSVAPHTRVDMQLTWRLTESGEFSLVGQNLLRDHHLETIW